jgi:GT2 family glycosyltransferase
MKPVTVGIVNYNGIATISETLSSLQQLDYPNFEVIVADNCSTDGSREWIQDHHPEVKCLCLESNQGSANARQVLLEASQNEYILFLDNDIALESNALSHLMQVMEKVPNAAACHPDILDNNDPTSYRYNGGWIHYLCASIPRSLPGKSREEYEIFDVVSGAALLVKREAALKIGGFDSDYFFNWEDGDFTARLTLAGYLCLNVPQAIVHHRSKPRGTSKAFYMVRNRWYFIIKLYSVKTLIFAVPMLLIFEISQGLLLILKGAGKDYFQGNLAVIQALPILLKKRKEFQKLKVKSDHEWLRSGELYIPAGLIKGKVFTFFKQIYNVFFGAYWQLIKPFC